MNNTSSLTKPAIALLIGGILLALTALFQTILAFSNSEFSNVYLNVLAKFVPIVALLLSGMVIFGDLAMLKHTSYGLSLAASICGIIGGVLLGPLGWLLVLPVSIWAVVVLRKPECKGLFVILSMRGAG